ncbi:murein biosynthesis integral membrane protein MurJ [Streptomyces sulphureus]|uniref:murein biosynthesis integral membrane protein MurJ n=1 Tax=Streptomyces sulphureus TaxID=47758 RepID=UPI00036A9EF7|nr:murein biosynthesis integral membrane protein MurJ [Streptomyces sulphureus]
MNAPYGGDRDRTPGDDSEQSQNSRVPGPPQAEPPPAPEPPYDEGALQPEPPATPPADPRAWGTPADEQPRTGDPTSTLDFGNPTRRGTPEAPGGRPTVDLGRPTDGTATPHPHAFAHLFRDQGQDGGTGGPPPAQPPLPGYGPPPPAPQTPPGPPAASPAEGLPEPGTAAPEPVAEPGGPDETAAVSTPAKSGGLLKSSAIMAAGTMVSRLTGFVRNAMTVVALGVAMLGDSYQLAITIPTMLYTLTVGGGLNSVFVPQLVRAMKRDDDGGEAYANRLLTLVACVLGGLTGVALLAAPLLVPLMSGSIANNPEANGVAVSFIQYCLPTIFFMGIHVVIGQILNARGRFGAMMWTPVLNNVVIISTLAMFLAVYGPAASSEMTVSDIPPEAVRLLGIGTLLGLVVQALAMIPYLRATGFRLRPRFDWRGHGLGKAAKLAKWTIFFVLANQAGVLVVSQLSTWAQASAERDGHAGVGFSAYSNAQLIWNMPQAIITVSVMAALLPRLSRSASDGDSGAVRDDISQGLRNSAVAIVPIAFGFVALGIPMCTLIYGSAGTASAQNIGYMLMAFGIGLIPFSVQYVVLRAFYAYEDTRTPFYNTVIVAAVNAAASALCFLLLPARWAVVGMAASYGLAYIIGVVVAWQRLRRKLDGSLDGRNVVRTYVRLAGASVPATLVAGGVVYVLTQALGSGTLGSIVALLLGGVALLAVFVLAAKRMRIAEMTTLLGMVRSRLGR